MSDKMGTWPKQSFKLNFLRVCIFITVLFYGFTSYSQLDAVAGVYYLQIGNEEEHLIEYSLTMNPDGTFLFHSHRDHKKGIPFVTHSFGKGTWSVDGKVVAFTTDPESDIDEKHTLDFSNSKARYITKSPRDKTDRIVKTQLQFFESDIFWIERLRIMKN